MGLTTTETERVVVPAPQPLPIPEPVPEAEPVPAGHIRRARGECGDRVSDDGSLMILQQKIEMQREPRL